MGIEKMELINIYGKLSDLNSVLIKCVKSKCFHMEQAIHSTKKITRITPLVEENPYSNCLSLMKTTAINLGLELGKCDFDDVLMDSAKDFEEYAVKISEEYKSVNKKLHENSVEISQFEQIIEQVEHLWGLDVDFERLFACEYVKIRMGKIPINSLEKIDYYEDNNFIFVPFKKDDIYAWGMYMAPTGEISIADYIMSTLYFERFRVPDYVTGTPEIANQKLLSRKNELKEENERLQKDLERIKLENNFQKIYSKISYLNSIFNLRKNVAVMDDHFYLVGFVPSKKATEFKEVFNDIKDVSVAGKPPETDLDLIPPTKLKNNFFAKPFSLFVEMYGLPSYKDINPTTFFAIVYCLLFGIMYGDVGQGGVLLIVGLFMTHKLKKSFGGIVTRLGISSVIFGFLYGSIFGFEHAMDPMYKLTPLGRKPLEVMHEINFVIMGAIVIGVIIISLSILFNIILGLKQKDYVRAIFGNNGLAGLIFYLAVIFGIAGEMLLNIKLLTPIYIIFLIIFPIVIMFFRVPLGMIAKYKSLKYTENEPVSIVNFIAENFFEVFEFVLSFLSNTLSFLRVGGFALCHAGLMLVVMNLSEMAGGGASTIVIIIGNIFVMGLEGLIVGIQVMRLGYYEMFSRFYKAQGKKFSPVGLN